MLHSFWRSEFRAYLENTPPLSKGGYISLYNVTAFLIFCQFSELFGCFSKIPGGRTPEAKAKHIPPLPPPSPPNSSQVKRVRPVCAGSSSPSFSLLWPWYACPSWAYDDAWRDGIGLAWVLGVPLYISGRPVASCGPLRGAGGGGQDAPARLFSACLCGRWSACVGMCRKGFSVGAALAGPP